MECLKIIKISLNSVAKVLEQLFRKLHDGKSSLETLNSGGGTKFEVE